MLTTKFSLSYNLSKNHNHLMSKIAAENLSKLVVSINLRGDKHEEVNGGSILGLYRGVHNGYEP